MIGHMGLNVIVVFSISRGALPLSKAHSLLLSAEPLQLQICLCFKHDRAIKTMAQNKQVVLKNYVSGYPKEADFGVKSSVLQSYGQQPGSVLVKNLYLACDPYMRHRMAPHASHASTIIHSYELGSAIVGYGVAIVVKSMDVGFKEGDVVWGLTGWEEYSTILNTKGLNKIQHVDVPLSYYAGILGMPGIAAYVGFYNICLPKEGDTVYVSSAAGGVGQLVGQFAKMAGCYVVGSASTCEKVDLLKNKLGFHNAFNYKDTGDLGTTLKQYFPEGIDIYFDNVGGQMLDEVLMHMRIDGRIAACGMISQYNLEKPEGVHNLFNVIMKRVQMKGFVETDFKHAYNEYLELAVKYLKEGKLVYVEDIADGLENAASAWVGIYHGRNVGKQIVRVAPE